VSRDVIVMTGLDPVIHELSPNPEGDGRNNSGHDAWGSRDFALLVFIAVRL
jgi:hypothetical protein